MNILELTPDTIFDLIKACDNFGYKRMETAAKEFILQPDDKHDIGALNIDEQHVIQQWRIKTRKLLNYRD